MTEKEAFIRMYKTIHPEYTDDEIEKKYKSSCELFKKVEPSRHATKTERINYRSWKDFDVVGIFAANSSHPLKSMFLGYAFRGDIPCNDKFVQTSSVSYEVSLKASSKEGITIDILSYDDAVKKAKNIDWSKVKIEH